MDIAQVHFYVEDAQRWRDRFVQQLGFRSIATQTSSDTLTAVVQSGGIHMLLSSPRTPRSPVAHYLHEHPAGVVDVAFRVTDLVDAVSQSTGAGAQVIHPIQSRADLRLAQVAGWAGLRHTLIETADAEHGAYLTDAGQMVCYRSLPEAAAHLAHLTAIDHVVLNVEAGDLQPATLWYERAFGLQRQQTFAIQTDRSGLCSQVLTHPQGSVQFPINEPASKASQIQEFLDLNRGAGIQHIALQTPDIVQTIAHLRQQGIAFLDVPFTYFEQLKQRSGFSLTDLEWQAIAAQQVLVDWQPELPEALLLQAFTQPIFTLPTFFFELIERRAMWVDQQYRAASGFGEGNFRALFEAIEQAQIQRGSLSPS